MTTQTGTHEAEGLAPARTLVEGLRDLRENCPESVSDRVLAATGVVDSYAEMAGPIWPLIVAWGRAGVSAIERADDPGAFEDEYQARTGRPVRRVDAVPARLARAVLRRIGGERVRDLAVDLSGLPEFQRRVLAKTMEIPFGEVRPYAWVAEQIGHPRAQRAVGTALALNPIPFVIPCHRVVRSDGRIGQYGAGGPSAKRAVLASEGLDPDELERLAARGVRFVGSETTRIFCFPSCHHARRIGSEHRTSFRSWQSATEDGYRPCRACRPSVGVPVAA
ncbi:MAG: methylated-DNA--[protein]-cysteine S-methyltransferase [Chloroflexota bacterium]|nr:methylated-DNA--[protein]-cysteine S-methyltransferase [Chloroflexota bacterium]